MRTPSFQRGVEHFNQQNAFLLAVLGLVSASSTIDKILERHAPPRTAPREGAAPKVIEASTEDPLLLASLGLVSLRMTWRAQLQRVVSTGSSRGVSTDVASTEATSLLRLRELLR